MSLRAGLPLRGAGKADAAGPRKLRLPNQPVRPQEA